MNIYNHYFCFYKYSSLISNYLSINIPKKCKYYFYLNIIYNSRFLYNKTDYFLADFSSAYTSPGEAFLIFKEMMAQNLNAHYMTKRKDIYKQYYNHYNISIKKLPIIRDVYIDGEFLEKYLDLILKIKVAISGALIYSVDNLFFNIGFITYICLGHGISYFKGYLYKNYYGYKRYNKILLPHSDKIIEKAKNFGWLDENIIKIGLPKWDILVDYEKSTQNHLSNNHSIFIMFTWREINRNKSISKFYFKNIFKLINDNKLNEILKKKKINIYFALHHIMLSYKKLFLTNKLIKYINQDKIIDCLKKSSLYITDFSSVIFDFIVRKRPFIIFIPDYGDPDINLIYSQKYYDIINGIMNDSIPFENKYNTVKDTIKKILFYINNNFTLEKKLSIFYDSFKLKGGNNIKNFIDYTKSLK